MTKRMTIMLIFVIILFGGIIGWHLFVNHMIKEAFAKPRPPQVVAAIKVQAQPWEPYIESVGSLVAQQNTNIMPQASGMVTKIYFKSGDIVKKGDPIVDLNLDVNIATLKHDEAVLALNKVNYKRYKELVNQGVISQSDYDSALSNYQQSEAQVAEDKANIAYKRVVAPFDGKLGIRLVNLGEYLNVGQTAIVNIQTIDPMELDFSVTQQDLSNLKVGQSVVFETDSYPNQEFKGTIIATDAGFNSDSRMLLVRALLPNPKHLLYPAMYGNVKVLLPAQENVIALPQTAIENNLYGSMVYLVKQKGNQLIANQVFVQMGQRRGNLVVITKGIQAGDTVVTTGQVKLYDGAAVKIDDSTGTQ